MGIQDSSAGGHDESRQPPVRMLSRANKAFLSLKFDFDGYLNPLVPRSRLDRLPKPLSRFLGYRDSPGAPVGNVAVASWALLGGFVGTAALSGFYMSDFIKHNGGPIIIGSYGAAAILEYNAIESPFSQPRNAIFGQFLSAVIGVCITKLFAHSADFESIRWLAGALSVGIASAAMTLTGTVHPPAGATALLAAVDQKATNLGWLYLPVILISSLLTTAVACLLNNVHRQYPIYWWTPLKPAETKKPSDEEANRKPPKSDEAGQDATSTQIVVSTAGLEIPASIYLSDPERTFLESLRKRLEESRDTPHAGGSDDEKVERYLSHDGSHSEAHSSLDDASR